MSNQEIKPVFQNFLDRDGQPLENGYVYIGTAGLDAVANPQTVYWDAAGTIPATQPIRTSGGYLMRSGSAAQIFVGADYSISVKDRNQVVINSALTVPQGNNADQLYYTSQFTGGVERTLTSRLADQINIFDFIPVALQADILGYTSTDDVDSYIQDALDYVESLSGGTIYFPAGRFNLANTIIWPTNTNMKGIFGEMPSQGTTATVGTIFRWTGVSTDAMFECYDIRECLFEGFCIDGNGSTGLIGIYYDSSAGASAENFWTRFAIRDCKTGVLWGNSGFTGNAAAGYFKMFTIWSTVTDSVGFYINSSNVGQQCRIEHGGIQVDSLGIDLVVCNLLQIKQVFGGGRMKLGFIRAAYTQSVLIEGCSSECWGDATGRTFPNEISELAFFLKTVPPSGGESSLRQLTLCLKQNQINNPIICTQAVRILSEGDSFGICRSIADETVFIGAKGTFTALSVDGYKSCCVAINPGFDITEFTAPGVYTKGWQDSSYVNLEVISPDRGWVTPTFNAGDFTGSGAMLWTVEAGDVETYAYQQVGRTMTVSFKINSSSISVANEATINIKIPNSKTSTKGMVSSVRLNNNSITTGFCYVTAGGTNIIIQPSDAAVFATATNSLQVLGQITFEID